MEERKICDYFVIAGLPSASKRTPEKCDSVPPDDQRNQSPQHPNHQATNELAPITDITIIITSAPFSEEVPEGYTCIEHTPSGFPADLNHGSIKCPSIFLCYRRGTDKPPLTDIGVFYETKDDLMKDTMLVEQSFYGNCGNINNGNSKIYLTYRRSKPDAPCNQLVVTDICVILKNKGESPPHAFNLIQRNLNKGFVGSDVFICYKKSMNSPPLLRYTPSIIDRYPQEDLDCYPLPESISMFCLPLGSTIECWPKENTKVLPLLSTFILTSNTGAKVYGVALMFYENFPVDEIKTISNAELKQLGYFSGFEQINKKLVVNKAICILSRWPFFDIFEGFLNYLYKSVFRSSRKPLNLPIEVYISHFMMNIPFPSIQRPKIRIQLSQLEEDQLTLSNPFEETPLPLSGATFVNFLQTLGVDNCMNVFLFALTEQKILLHSLRLDVLTSVAEALTSLIFPFHWQCPYIPLTPLRLCDVLNAPLPFIVGVDSRYFDTQLPPADLICVDIDTRSIYLSETKRNLDIRLVPKKAYKNLRKTLEQITQKLHLTRLDLKKEQPSISFSQISKKLEAQFGVEIQEAFLQFMTFILKDFRTYLMPIKKQPSIGSTDPSSLFDFKEFIASKEKAYHQFYTLMVGTQMFTRFIEERTFFSDKYTSLAFFDECLNKIESTENADFSTFQLIELDDRDKNDRTVFISDPESLVNLADYGQAYKYSKFGPFNHELFLKEPILSHFDNYRKASVESRSFENIGSTNNRSSSNLNLHNSTSSPMMKRTKHEVRSAQRVAKRLAESPLTWSKCLISYCFSIWFVHLHSYVRANQQLSLKAKLKIAFNVLLRMQSLDLHPLDEVCYRILMLLSGVYSQPVLAVKILHEMKKNNVTANAITYCYYSKAVLESDWKTSDDATDENLHWKKLRNLIDCVAELRRSGQRFAKRRLKEGNNLLNYELTSTANSSAHSTNHDLSTLSTLDKHDSLFNRQNSKTGSSFREKRLSKNRSMFNDEMNQRSSIVKCSSMNQFGNHEMVGHSPEAGLLINSQVYQSHSKQKKLFDRRRHKSEEHASNQSAFNLSKIKEELSNLSSNLSASNALISGRNMPRSKSLSIYRHGAVNSSLHCDLLGYKTILEQHTRTPSTASSQVSNPVNESSNDLNHQRGAKEQRRPSDEQIHKNLQSMDSLDSESSTFSPLKDAIKNINPFFSSTIRSSLRFTKDFAKNQLAKNSLFKTSLSKQSSVGGGESQAADKKLRDSLPENGLSTESLENKPESAEIKCNMTRSSTLPLSISGSTASNESETSKQSNSSIENESAGDRSEMTKSHSSTDFNSIWSSKFNTTFKLASSTVSSTVSRLSEFKSNLSASSNHGSPSKTSATTPAAQAQTSSINNSALFTNLSQNTSALFTNIATMVAEKLPTNMPISEYYDYYMTSGDWTDGGDQQAAKQQTETFSSDKFFETLNQQYRQNKDPETGETIILKIEITSCTKCYNCLAILYDEDIMGEWSPDDSNLNTTCRYCEKLIVPKLTIRVKRNTKFNVTKSEEQNNLIDLENGEKPSESDAPATDTPADDESFEDHTKFSVAYLSPIVLRKELENVVDNEGDFCLTNPQFTLEHDIIYWNLVWYFKRTRLPTHLSGLYLTQFLKEKYGDDLAGVENGSSLDFRNVAVKCFWDNEDLFTDLPKPLYYYWRKSYNENEEESRLVSALVTDKRINDNRLIFRILLKYIYEDDLISAIRIFIHKRKTSKTSPKYIYSIYRDLLYLLFAAVEDKKAIDHIAFDRLYRHAYDSLTFEEAKLMRITDKPPSLKATFCRRTFKHLHLKVNP